jgi:hypothetical protein
MYYVTPCTPCFHVNVYICCFREFSVEMREATLPLCTIIQCSNNSAKCLARENNKSKTYLQLMSFIQMTKTTNIYIYNKSNLIIVYFNVSVQRIYKIFRYQNVLDFMSVSDRKLSNVFKNPL